MLRLLTRVEKGGRKGLASLLSSDVEVACDAGSVGYGCGAAPPGLMCVAVLPLRARKRTRLTRCHTSGMSGVSWLVGVLSHAPTPAGGMRMGCSSRWIGRDGGGSAGV